MPNSPEGGRSPSPPQNRRSLTHSSERIWPTDESIHLVQDYWKLNEITVKNSYPLPLVSDMLTRLHDAEWFTTLDLRWGFNNVHLKEGDKWKAAFSMNRRLFELLVMFFRLCNSPTTFQTMMNDILRPFINHNE